MFIDRERHQRIRAPEERNVLEESYQQHSAPLELRYSVGLSNYKHFVPPGLAG